MKNLFITLVAGIFLVVAPPARAAALSATQSPTSAASVGSSGTGWTSSTLANALLVDGVETNLTSAMPLNSATKLLVLTGFNFNIPAGATIVTPSSSLSAVSAPRRRSRRRMRGRQRSRPQHTAAPQHSGARARRPPM